MPSNAYIKITGNPVRHTEQLPVSPGSMSEINVDYDEYGDVVAIEVIDALDVTTDSGEARTVLAKEKK